MNEGIRNLIYYLQTPFGSDIFKILKLAVDLLPSDHEVFQNKFQLYAPSFLLHTLQNNTPVERTGREVNKKLKIQTYVWCVCDYYPVDFTNSVQEILLHNSYLEPKTLITLGSTSRYMFDLSNANICRNCTFRFVGLKK